MSVFPPIRTRLVGAAALVALAGPAALQAAGAGHAAAVGQVSLIIGEARVARNGGGAEQLRQGSDVFVGDRVITGANGHVHLRFVDRGAVSVRPSSVLEVQSYRFDPAHPQASEVRLKIEQGTARSISGEATEVDKSRFRLNTPIAAIGVRGTDFIVQSLPGEVRAAVAQGAISLAPLGADCLVAALGPCGGAAEKVLSADMGRLMVELRSGEQVARLAPAVAALLPASPHFADAAARERLVAEASVRAAAVAAAQPSLDPVARNNDRTAADVLAIIPAGTFDARRLTTPPDTQAQLVWGRWSWARGEPDNISVEYARASAGRHATVGDGMGALFRSGERSTFEEATPRLEASKVDLALTRAHASFEVGGRFEAASVDGGTLSLDFGQRTFATALAMSSASGGRAELRVGGPIQASGIFNAGDAEQRVSGAVTFDGKEAGYLFDRAAAGGFFRGRTLWGKRP